MEREAENKREGIQLKQREMVEKERKRRSLNERKQAQL